MDCSTPAPPSITNSRRLLKHVHRVGDAIQPSHSLSSPSPPAFNLSQHQGLFQRVFFTSGGHSSGASASASVLSMNIQDCTCLGLATHITSFIHHNHRRVCTVLNILCLTCSSLPSPPPAAPSSAITDLFIVFTVLPFSECHVVIQYEPLQAGFFHLALCV